MAIFITLLLGAAIIAWVLSAPYLQRYNRKKVMAKPFPAAWRDTLKRRLPYFRVLPADLQLQLKKHIQVFMAEKQFIGCDGLTVTDEMRVTIAAQACLLLLNRPNYYYPKLKQILLYPSAFVVSGQQADAAGVMHEQRRVLSGESWGLGKVILSWADTLDGAATPDDGRNVVIHEFAHQLDQEKGVANGAPLLERSSDYKQWSGVMAEEFNRLQLQAQGRQHSLFDHYGATNPAEFFAVISEVFFEQPQQLSSLHPKLYQQLSQFYRLNPLSWA
ncbi:zinc-dependent peptidase [Rheinheimera baltica]|uniref:M90 family metallopeptidase n=1 Tax=Rheinheimera baltica TaxID=67576 RepID=UPI00273D8158|nr:M90 family metallopeptidase [Rheinheimera baltica]MDP5142544.1 zinc-dependent peptidase [Rheinheimera baltica]MDP5150417.1 zinc-dependent peptidase [Rheinheimera baltica]MDP5189679.1 zinc-dependent peptidase [Rheinheimera baltica]